MCGIGTVSYNDLKIHAVVNGSNEAFRELCLGSGLWSVSLLKKKWPSYFSLLQVRLLGTVRFGQEN